MHVSGSIANSPTRRIFVKALRNAAHQLVSGFGFISGGIGPDDMVAGFIAVGLLADHCLLPQIGRAFNWRQCEKELVAFCESPIRHTLDSAPVGVKQSRCPAVLPRIGLGIVTRIVER